MKLSLARWDDHQGKSIGYWIIREIPGFCLVKVHGRWNISCIGWLEHDTLRKQATAKAWGENYKARSELYSSLREKLARRAGSKKDTGFATRREALFALEAELAKKTEAAFSQTEKSSLKQILTQHQ